jgi:hemerythrin
MTSIDIMTPATGADIRHLWTNSRKKATCGRAYNTKEFAMELQPYGQFDNHFPGMQTGSLEFAESKLNYDSRYRNIISLLDMIIESVRQRPGRKITTELDRLLDIMMGHICPENNFMALLGYPHETKHRNHHYYMFEITNDLNSHFAIGKNVLIEELVNLRLLWLMHIQLHDRDFEEFLISSPGSAASLPIRQRFYTL